MKDRPAFTTVATLRFDLWPAPGPLNDPEHTLNEPQHPLSGPKPPEHPYPSITQVLGSFTWETKFRDTFAGKPQGGTLVE